MPEDTIPNPTGWTEAERLAALRRYGVLDTPRETEFDEITRVASLVCDAPMALVSLVEEGRQWFKSERGVGLQETSLDVSFCAHAILAEDVLVVPDAAEDPRFRENALVTGEPHLRFYAGARIDTPGGYPLGTVCVLDNAPRPEGLSAKQKAVLVALAKQAAALLELRRASEARDLLGQELRHRIKNVFAVVGGLVSASSRAHPEAKDFVQSLQGRLTALAKAQEYVQPAREANPQVANPLTLQALIETVLAPYAERGGRMTIDGDDADVGPNAATSLALIVHEQGTNAVKYGSLSHDQGRLDIDCRNDGERFVVTWQETGGPRLDGAPERQGFGARLAARSAAQLDGEVVYDWHEAGLRMRLDLAADRLGS